VPSSWRRHIAGLQASSRKLSPFVAGDTFTLADCGGAVHLPLVASATKIVYGRDMHGRPAREATTSSCIGERPAVQQVNAERKTNTEQMLAAAKAKAQAKT
jgi:glutathione S-transferase